jgi:diguanylate cyclase (GGDEF)-like protein
MAARAREHAEVRLPYTLLMMDVDNFKNVNDTYGHLAGDAVLRAVAEALTASIRKEDVAARYGGEEFAIFLPGRTAEESLAIAERIRTAVEAIRVHLSGSGKPIRVTISVGMASSPQHGLEHPQILDQADAALYRAKRSGKNQVSVAAQAQ